VVGGRAERRSCRARRLGVGAADCLAEPLDQVVDLRSAVMLLVVRYGEVEVIGFGAAGEAGVAASSSLLQQWGSTRWSQDVSAGSSLIGAQGRSAL
jgi:hypothetical protein